jgi:hypothetical protein
MEKVAKTYPTERRYVLETDYGCYTDYGWTVANSRETFEEGMYQFNFWNKTGGGIGWLMERLEKFWPKIEL